TCSVTIKAARARIWTDISVTLTYQNLVTDLQKVKPPVCLRLLACLLVPGFWLLASSATSPLVPRGSWRQRGCRSSCRARRDAAGRPDPRPRRDVRRRALRPV